MPRSKPPATRPEPPIVVLHGEVKPEAGEADQDTLLQSRWVTETLRGLTHPVETLSMGLRLELLKERLAALRPWLVFNLVESVDGSDALLPLAPLVLESMAIPYTGAPLAALVATGNKLEAKRIMRREGIPTPEVWSPKWKPNEGDPSAEWIVKAVWEQASFGMDDHAIAPASEAVAALLRQREATLGGHWFAERFIPGREFNLSLLESESGVTVLPPAEIHFQGFPDGKPHIVGYAAKWEPTSPEYLGTVRGFDFPSWDDQLLETLTRLSRECWEVFGLRGYARVDFRVDAQGNPWVLEVNANPCLSPDAGLIASATRAGLDYPQVIQRILQATHVNPPSPAGKQRRLSAAIPLSTPLAGKPPEGMKRAINIAVQTGNHVRN